jgi:hypothetical protein
MENLTMNHFDHNLFASAEMGRAFAKVLFALAIVAAAGIVWWLVR